MLWFVSPDKSAASFRVRTNLSSRSCGLGSLTTNYINLLVAQERAAWPDLRGWRALHACFRAIDHARRLSGSAGACGGKRSRPMEAGGRGSSGIEKRSQKGKWCSETDGPVDARL